MYDDEYDDSFDDLGAGAAEGEEEAENSRKSRSGAAPGRFAVRDKAPGEDRGGSSSDFTRTPGASRGTDNISAAVAGLGTRGGRDGGRSGLGRGGGNENTWGGRRLM